MHIYTSQNLSFSVVIESVAHSASLDTATERTLIERLMRSATDKTMIFITHREMILNYCEEVIKLEKA